MGVIFGRIASEPRFRVIRKSRLPMREIYLNNDHRVHYIVEERTTGVKLSGLQLTASLSRNPTGSVATSIIKPGPLVVTNSFTSSFSLTQTFSETYEGGFTSSFTESVYNIISESFTASVSESWEGPFTGSSDLQVILSEDPAGSGEYVGIIPGGDITSVLSSSFEDSMYEVVSSSLEITSSFVSGGNAVDTTVISSSHFVTQSFTSSVETPLVGTAPRVGGIYEIIVSGSQLQVSTPMVLRSVRYAP